LQFRISEYVMINTFLRVTTTLTEGPIQDWKIWWYDQGLIEPAPYLDFSSHPCFAIIEQVADLTYWLTFHVDMGPDPTRAYFWPTVNKRPTRLRPRYFLTQLEEIFFYSKGLKIEKFNIFRGNFPNLNSNQKWLTWPDPGQNFLTQTHHYPLNHYFKH